MKTILFVIISVFALARPAYGQLETISGFKSLSGQKHEVTQTVLSAYTEIKPTKEEVTKQKAFVEGIKYALEKSGLQASICVAFYEDEKATNAPAKTYVLPKFMTTTDQYVVRVKKSALANSDLFLKHVALHEIARIICGYLNPVNPFEKALDEMEKERRAECVVFNMIGWGEYKELCIDNYNRTTKRPTKEGQKQELIYMQMWLGIYPQEKEDAEKKES